MFISPVKGANIVIIRFSSNKKSEFFECKRFTGIGLLYATDDFALNFEKAGAGLIKKKADFLPGNLLFFIIFCPNI